MRTSPGSPDAGGAAGAASGLRARGGAVPASAPEGPGLVEEAEGERVAVEAGGGVRVLPAEGRPGGGARIERGDGEGVAAGAGEPERPLRRADGQHGRVVAGAHGGLAEQRVGVDAVVL